MVRQFIKFTFKIIKRTHTIAQFDHDNNINNTNNNNENDNNIDNNNKTKQNSKLNNLNVNDNNPNSKPSLDNLGLINFYPPIRQIEPNLNNSNQQETNLSIKPPINDNWI